MSSRRKSGFRRTHEFWLLSVIVLLCVVLSVATRGILDHAKLPRPAHH